MHIWVTPAKAWHFYWGNLTSPHFLSPCKSLLSRNRSWEIFWLPVPLLLVLPIHTQTEAEMQGG